MLRAENQSGHEVAVPVPVESPAEEKRLRNNCFLIYNFKSFFFEESLLRILPSKSVSTDHMRKDIALLCKEKTMCNGNHGKEELRHCQLLKALRRKGKSCRPRREIGKILIFVQFKSIKTRKKEENREK